jgi:hypothetical protein
LSLFLIGQDNKQDGDILKKGASPFFKNNRKYFNLEWIGITNLLLAASWSTNLEL